MMTDMSTLKVIGGKKLTGEIEPIPNKNSLVAALPAALLSDQDVVFFKVPQTSDVEKILKVIVMLGAKVTRDIEKVTINAADLNSYVIDPELGSQMRATLMFAGPLLARFGKAVVPMPGGCELGMRSISAHVDAFTKAGVKVYREGPNVVFEAPSEVKTDYRVWQIEASVSATENLAMYCAGIDAEVSIIDAACEPHVSDLMRLLTAMGAKVDGVGSNLLKIKGTRKFKTAEFLAGPDFVDIAGLFVAAAVTRGRITVKNAYVPEIVDGLIDWFRLFNVEIEVRDKDIVVDGVKDLRIDTENSGFPLAAVNLPKLVPRPWPGFPVDVIPVMAVIASRTKGRLLLQNWMYESGLEFVRELNAIGADIFVADPQRIIINGPVKFTGGDVTPPSVIQAVKAVFLASLCDDVTTTIHGVEILKRRYPNIFEEYRSLGANLELLD
jgi:UDP-N-acetylglucosamine 1-carboxyvinyltransferase